jgi:hypothetical protein
MLSAAGGIIVAPNDTLLIGGSTQSPFVGGPSFAYLLNVDAKGHRLHQRGRGWVRRGRRRSVLADANGITSIPDAASSSGSGFDAALIRVAL